MKILITNTGPWGTGSFTVAKAVRDELTKLGHQVKLFFPDAQMPSKDLKYYYEHPDYIVWKFPIRKNGTSLESFPLIIPDPHPRSSKRKTLFQHSAKQRDLYFKEFEKQIKKLISKFNPDIIECQHIWAFDYIIHKLGFPFICTAHHSDQLGFIYDKKIRKIALKSAKKTSYIFAISEFVKQEVLKLYKVDEKKVIVLPNSYDKKIFKVLSVDRQKLLKMFNLKLPSHAKIISFAGKISKTKGIDILLKANKWLPKAKEIHFLILGSGNIEEVIPKKERKKYSFKNVHFLGHQSPQTLAKIHNISDFSILPSRSEGFGIAALEAMACALPLIVTNTGAMAQYAVGKVVKTDNAKDLGRAILELTSLSLKEYKKLSKTALKTAQKFSWKNITKKRLKYYKKIIYENTAYK